MGFGETIGLISVVGLMIAVIIAVVEMFKRFLRYKERRLASAEHTGRLAAANAELEERVRVLERIVTERGFDVAHQIEALRLEQDRVGGPKAKGRQERSHA
jgi:hypothetical protein